MNSEENQEKENIKPHYRYTCSNSSVGFLNLLNEQYEAGYKPIHELTLQEKGIDKQTGEIYIKREAYLYNTEDSGLTSDETSKRVQISLDILEAEFQVAKAHGDYTELEGDLRTGTDWNVVKAELGVDKLLADDKKAYINKKTRPAKDWYEECKQWLAHVKRLSALHEQAGKAPWVTEELPMADEDGDVEILETIEDMEGIE